MKKIIRWQEERRLTEGGFSHTKSVYNFMEELFEGLGFDSIMSKELAQAYTELIAGEVSNYEVIPTVDQTIDSLNDRIVFAIGDILKLGYDPVLTLDEVYKEINCRKQDPEQKERWNSGGRIDGEKWQKDVDQDPSETYTANFSNCLLKDTNDTLKAEKEELRTSLMED